jgi:hypothetical protein
MLSLTESIRSTALSMQRVCRATAPGRVDVGLRAGSRHRRICADRTGPLPGSATQGMLTTRFHIPPDYVVDQWALDVESRSYLAFL